MTQDSSSNVRQNETIKLLQKCLLCSLYLWNEPNSIRFGLLLEKQNRVNGKKRRTNGKADSATVDQSEASKPSKSSLERIIKYLSSIVYSSHKEKPAP